MIFKECEVGRIKLENEEEFFGRVYFIDSADFCMGMECDDGVRRTWTMAGKWYLAVNNETLKIPMKSKFDIKSFEVEK